jgi:FMN-dependent NADH-azoreductase
MVRTAGFSISASRFLSKIFGFIGFTDIREIFVEPTLATPTSKEESMAAVNRKTTRF